MLLVIVRIDEKWKRRELEVDRETLCEVGNGLEVESRKKSDDDDVCQLREDGLWKSQAMI